MRGPIPVAATVLVVVFLYLTQLLAVPFPVEKTEQFKFPPELGYVWKDLYDYAGGNLVAVMVQDYWNPASWVVVQKRGTQYAQTVFSEKVWNVEFSLDGSILIVETASSPAGSRVHVLSSAGQVLWNQTTGSGKAGISTDGSVVFVSTKGESEESPTPAWLKLYSASNGSFLGERTFTQRVTGTIVLSSAETIVSYPDKIEKFSGGTSIWSVSPPQETITLDALGTTYFAARHPMGRTRIYNVQGNLVFDYDPATLALSFPPLTEASLKQMAPFYVAPNRVIFVDTIHLAPSVIDVNLATGVATHRPFLAAHPSDYRPARRLFEGRLAWVKANRIVLLDIR